MINWAKALAQFHAYMYFVFKILSLYTCFLCDFIHRKTAHYSGEAGYSLVNKNKWQLEWSMVTAQNTPIIRIICGSRPCCCCLPWVYRVSIAVPKTFFEWLVHVRLVDVNGDSSALRWIKLQVEFCTCSIFACSRRNEDIRGYSSIRHWLIYYQSSWSITKAELCVQWNIYLVAAVFAFSNYSSLWWCIAKHSVGYFAISILMDTLG